MNSKDTVELNEAGAAFGWVDTSKLPVHHCQYLRADVCLAANLCELEGRTVVVCPPFSCDIDDEMRYVEWKNYNGRQTNKDQAQSGDGAVAPQSGHELGGERNEAV